MQGHALALGYFSLAALCGYFAAATADELHWIYVVASIAALLAGISYLAYSCRAFAHAAWYWLLKRIEEAQQAPRHNSLPAQRATSSHRE
jgi:hypothetical protein